MKKILITQRVYENESYAERRDCLDQKWSSFFLELGVLPIIVPNNIKQAQNISNAFENDGVLLTGGNGLASLGGDAPERDRVEAFLLEESIKHNKPVLGVCRGMQVIQDFYGEKLTKISGHVAKRHKLIEISGRLTEELICLKDVNSFHNYGCTENLSNEIRVTSRSEDNIIMSVEHIEHAVYGQMWHPEREDAINEVDIKIFKKVFGI